MTTTRDDGDARTALCREIRQWDYGQDDGHHPTWIGNLADHLIAAGYQKQEQR